MHHLSGLPISSISPKSPTDCQRYLYEEFTSFLELATLDPVVAV